MESPGKKTLALHALNTVVVNTIIAAAISAFGDRSFPVTFVYSQFIGLSIWAFIDLGRIVVIRDPATDIRRLIWWAPTGAILGYLLGTFLGDAVFGESMLSALFQSPESTRRTVGYLLMSVALAAGASYFFLSREQLHAAREQAEKMQRQASETQLRLLQAQLEPHMLFNTLANLRALIAADPPRAQIMLDHVIGFLRSTLEASQKTEHTLEQEFARLKDYLELMSVRMGSRLSYRLLLPQDLAKINVPTLLLQPVVENSIRHGLEPKVDGGNVTVEAIAQNAGLLIRSTDTGVGFTFGEERPISGGGFGLKQLRDRLETTYKTPASVSIESHAGAGTTVEIFIPPKT